METSSRRARVRRSRQQRADELPRAECLAFVRRYWESMTLRDALDLRLDLIPGMRGQKIKLP